MSKQIPQHNILHIIDNLWLWGAQTVLQGITSSWDTPETIHVYALRKYETEIQIAHDKTSVYPSSSKFSFPLLTLRKYIKKHNITLLHCHLAKSQLLWCLLKTFFFPDIKLVLHEHGEIYEDGKVYPFLMNLFRSKVDIYIAVSESIQRTILRKTSYPETKVPVLYNFVNLDVFYPLSWEDTTRIRTQYRYSRNDFVIGFAGRLIERKWWKEFVASAKILRDKGYDIKFLIAWDWPERVDLLQEISWVEHIQYIGYIDTMREYYNILDCFVFPSHWEPLGLTGIEANACWCPVIASDIEGLNELMIHQENALLFENKNIDDLVIKIEEIYNHHDVRERLVKYWKERVQNYSLEKYLVELQKIYG